MPHSSDVGDVVDRERSDVFMYVVARDRTDIYEHLRASFRDLDEVVVLLDRRHRDRRHQSLPHSPDRRRLQRRSTTPENLAARGWILVRPRRRADI